MAGIGVGMLMLCIALISFWRYALSEIEPMTVNSSDVDAEIDNNVYVLNLKNFDEFINSKDTVMVEFYAPWCGHCKNLAPIYEKAAKRLKDRDPPVFLAKVDATIETELFERFELTGYPSLKVFKRGVMIDYDGSREEDDIVEAMIEYSDPNYQFPKNETLELTSANFSKFTDNEDFMVVMFYAPWCGHCKKMLPEYEKAAKEFAKRDPPVLLAKVDGTTEKELSTRFDVTGFPTFKMFRKGKAYPFNSDAKDKWSIIEYINGHLDLGSTLLSDLKELRSKINSKEAFVVLMAFFDSANDDTFKTYLDLVNEKRDDFSFYHSFESSHRAVYNFESSTLAIFYTEMFQSDYEPKWQSIKILSDTKVSELSDFLSEHQVPLVGEYNQRTKEKEYKNKRPLIFFFCTVDWSFEHRDGTQLWRKKFLDVAVANPELTFVMADDDSNKEIFNEFGFDESGEDINVGILSEDNRKFPMKPMEDFDAEEVQTFITKFKKGKLKPLVKSQPIPKRQTGPVTVVVGKSFKDIVLESKKDVLIEFYAPWCGHCKKLEPIYKELAKKLKSDKNIIVAKMDATANDSPSNFHVSGYPTIYFVKKDLKDSPISFGGERTLEGLMKFVEENKSASESTAKTEL